MVMVIMVTAYSICQEFIKPKTKKPSVSGQQNAELDGELIVQGTQLSGALIDLSKAIFLVTQAAITRVNDYACGEKGCLTKVERAAVYEKKMRIKEQIERYVIRIEEMVASMNVLIASLDEQNELDVSN
jgi:hypothetical protein